MVLCCDHPGRDVRIRIQVQVRGERPVEHTYAYCRACTALLVARNTAAATRPAPREIRLAPPNVTPEERRAYVNALHQQRIQDELAGV
jgi:hypothetical protein